MYPTLFYLSHMETLFSSATSRNFMGKNVKESRVVLKKMMNMGLAPIVVSYNILINAYCKIKLLDEALDLFKEMGCKNLVPNTITYIALIDGLCKPKRMSHMQDIVYEMCCNGQASNIIAYNILLDAFGKMKHLDEAVALYQQIVN
ncbi:pentatricopeptide repeat-containing protein At1g62680, mitochondrial-like [Prosopis cineraria]|uniref:pentatricopeptide repeat-containing protein At1g62680, mitochondrial-like n=1 Tax=Prosopis cineraria TaxID=364024 RepID=UPI00240F5A4B|nr:pentatricopeptide repeat-containing protein At1g62680, mitochondrial-like [Prosopis cineraria]